jgi:hypothetical protein
MTVHVSREMKMAVFWVVASCSLVEVYGRFRDPCFLQHYENCVCSTQYVQRFNPRDRFGTPHVMFSLTDTIQSQRCRPGTHKHVPCARARCSTSRISNCVHRINNVCNTNEVQSPKTRLFASLRRNTRLKASLCLSQRILHEINCQLTAADK